MYLPVVSSIRRMNFFAHFWSGAFFFPFRNSGSALRVVRGGFFPLFYFLFSRFVFFSETKNGLLRETLARSSGERFNFFLFSIACLLGSTLCRLAAKKKTFACFIWASLFGTSFEFSLILFIYPSLFGFSSADGLKGSFLLTPLALL